MSSSERYERRLPTLLEELSAPRTPDYFDDILGQVGRTRQRPGWTFPERWLPVSAVSERLAAAPRAPVRAIVLVALLVIALVAAIAIIAGSQQHRVPAPFGLAGNGRIAFVDQTGAIRAGNPIDSTSSVIVAGAGHDRPVFSPDGTRLAYLQQRTVGNWDIVVAASDGSSPVVITNDPLSSIGHLGWTPDSRSVVADVPPGKLLAIDIASGSTPRVLSEAVDLDNFNNNLTDLFRPPAGDEILFVGSGTAGEGLYRQSLKGGAPIAILTAANSPVPFSKLDTAQWAPNGMQIAFTLNPPDNPDLGRAWVVNVDGSDLHRLSTLEAPGQVIAEGHLSWSPDGTRIAFGRWIQGPDGVDVDVRPVTVVDLATGHEREVGPVQVNGYAGWAWSPDGTSILEDGSDPSPYASQILVVDASTGLATPTGFRSGGAPTFQRTLPAP